MNMNMDMDMDMNNYQHWSITLPAMRSGDNNFWAECTFFKTCVICYAECPMMAGAASIGAAMPF